MDSIFYGDGLIIMDYMLCDVCGKEEIEDDMTLVECSWFVCPTCSSKHDDWTIGNICQGIESD